MDKRSVRGRLMNLIRRNGAVTHYSFTIDDIGYALGSINHESDDWFRLRMELYRCRSFSPTLHKYIDKIEGIPDKINPFSFTQSHDSIG